jgi:alpha-methylacyl-CoA racemase
MSVFDGLGERGLWREARGANLLDGGAPFYRCYACRDGRFVAVAALEPRFYAALLAGLGVPPEEAPQFPPDGWPALHARFETLFAQADRDDWVARFAGTEACVTPVLTRSEAKRHPHHLTREGFDADGRPRPAPVFDGRRATPALATIATLDEVLADWNGGSARA